MKFLLLNGRRDIKKTAPPKNITLITYGFKVANFCRRLALYSCTVDEPFFSEVRGIFRRSAWNLIMPFDI